MIISYEIGCSSYFRAFFINDIAVTIAYKNNEKETKTTNSSTII
jgi:hypothetical protein